MVTSGYKSLTFSNTIDPRKPFCPTELAGKTCDDPSCEEQHFRQVALTGACEKTVSIPSRYKLAVFPVVCSLPSQIRWVLIIVVVDDKILAQMSTANNLKTKAEHERWVAGLRQVIADLRSKGVKDFHMVASALAAYRRRFSEELSTPSSASSS
jgi:Putative zinc-finger domain